MTPYLGNLVTDQTNHDGKFPAPGPSSRGDWHCWSPLHPLGMSLIIFAQQHQEGVPQLCQKSEGNLVQTSQGHPGQGKANENNDSLDPSQDSQHPKVFHTVLKTPCTGLKLCRPCQTPTCLCGKLYAPKARSFSA